MVKPWNIKQLHDALQSDLQSCHTESEKTLTRAIGGKEIREFAESIDRKLTPGEYAIASMYGHR